jgi:phosphoglycolate phosphatase
MATRDGANPTKEDPFALAYDTAALNGVTVVFDLDGTLVETAPDLVATLNVLLEQEGIAPLPMAQARNMIGKGARAMVAKGFAASGQPIESEALDGLFERFIVHYRAHIADESHPYPGLTDALNALLASGAILGVCTNKRTDLSVALLKALGLDHYFKSIVGADLAKAPKPDASHLLTAIEAAGGAPARAIMVGDSASDAGAARAAGTPLILVTFGYTETPVTELGADIVIDAFDKLPAACATLTALFTRP